LPQDRYEHALGYQLAYAEQKHVASHYVQICSGERNETVEDASRISALFGYVPYKGNISDQFGNEQAADDQGPEYDQVRGLPYHDGANLNHGNRNAFSKNFTQLEHGHLRERRQEFVSFHSLVGEYPPLVERWFGEGQSAEYFNEHSAREKSRERKK